MTRHFFIHGDNVVECERARHLLSRALSVTLSPLSNSPVQVPIFRGRSDFLGIEVQVQVLSGHSRWGFDVSAALTSMGSTIRENADAVITETVGDVEAILFAIEYCGALPAGNNAWQRHGRAYSFGQAGVPYFIYNEIGGQELNADRTVKAPRFPNPAVPLSLVMFSRELGVAVLPVYEAAPSATSDQVRDFQEALGDEDVLAYIRDLVSGLSTQGSLVRLEAKATKLGLLLAKSRKRQDGYTDETWKNRLSAEDGTQFYLRHKVVWKLKSGDKVEISPRARLVFGWLNDKNLAAMGSTSLRLAVLDRGQRSEFKEFISEKYPETDQGFRDWLGESARPVVVALVTGFKPRGDDSRPDRGLVPLARMLAGQDADLVAFVSGPAKASMYEGIRRSPEKAATANGLLQSVFACSDWVLLDTKNEDVATVVDSRNFKSARNTKTPVLPGALVEPKLGEHDIDALFHYACTLPERAEVFEGMCNPPGGDWSGVNLKLEDGRVARWTSLPRVSGTKRPDHVIQTDVAGQRVILSVESKQNFSDLELGIGPNLKSFVTQLLTTETEVIQNPGEFEWSTAKPPIKAPIPPLYSIAIAVDGPQVNLDDVIQRNDLDFAFAFSLESRTQANVRVAAAQRATHMLAELVDALFTKSALDFKVCK